MKAPRYLFLLLTITGFLSSCSKEKNFTTAPAIVGRWMSTAVYTEQNGQFNWLETNSFREFVTFFPDARFAIFTDVPGGTGTYIYNNQARSIRLQFKDAAGGNVAVEERSVEDISKEKLVVAFFSSQGELVNKISYRKVD